jgi:hypothetical protein
MTDCTERHTLGVLTASQARATRAYPIGSA